MINIMGDLQIIGNFNVDVCNCRSRHIIMRSINLSEITLLRGGKTYRIDMKDLLKYAISRPVFNEEVKIRYGDKKFGLFLNNMGARNKKINLVFNARDKDMLPKRINGMHFNIPVRTTAFFLMDEKNDVKKNKPVVKNPFIYSNIQSGYSAKSFPQTIVGLNPWGRAQTTPMVGVAKLPTQ